MCLPIITRKKQQTNDARAIRVVHLSRDPRTLALRQPVRGAGTELDTLEPVRHDRRSTPISNSARTAHVQAALAALEGPSHRRSRAGGDPLPRSHFSYDTSAGSGTPVRSSGALPGSRSGHSSRHAPPLQSHFSWSSHASSAPAVVSHFSADSSIATQRSSRSEPARYVVYRPAERVVQPQPVALEVTNTRRNLARMSRQVRDEDGFTVQRPTSAWYR